MSSWRKPLAWIVVVTVVVEVLMVATDMDPNVVLVAALGGLVGVGVWVVVDIQPRTALAPPPLPVHAATDTLRNDRHATTRQRNLVYSRGNDHVNERLYARLVELIDDQLVAVHQVDRRHDPESAAEILGPELTRFVNDPDAAGSLAQIRRAEAIVTLIEQI